MPKVKAKAKTQNTMPEKIGLLRLLVETYYDVQDQRIRAAHRIRKYAELANIKPAQLRDWHDEVDKRMSSSEAFMKRKVQKLLKGEPLWDEWLVDVRGLGPCLTGGLLAWLDPARAIHASSFHKYAGQAVAEDGQQDRRRAGHKLEYNPKLKVLCWKIGESFVKQTSPKPSVYRLQYEHFRREIDGKPCSKVHKAKNGKLIVPEGECYDAHRFAKAKRKTVKLFLAHVWVIMRKLDVLPINEPYAFGILKHDPASHVAPLRDKGTWSPELKDCAEKNQKSDL